jgi:hypothetical protein
MPAQLVVCHWFTTNIDPSYNEMFEADTEDDYDLDDSPDCHSDSYSYATVWDSTNDLTTILDGLCDSEVPIQNPGFDMTHIDTMDAESSSDWDGKYPLIIDQNDLFVFTGALAQQSFRISTLED